MFNFPYLIETIDDINTVKGLDTVEEWINKSETENGIEVVSPNPAQGYRNIVAGKPALKPNDLKGLILCCSNMEVRRAAVSSLGCSVQGVDCGNICNNLVNKIIDGHEDVYPCIVSESYYEIRNMDTISETHNILLSSPVVVDAGWSNSPPEEYQDVLIEACDQVCSSRSDRVLGEFTEEAKQKRIGEGTTIIDHSEIDTNALRKAAKASYEQLGLADTYNEIMSTPGK